LTVCHALTCFYERFASLRCALAFGRAEMISFLCFPRASALGYLMPPLCGWILAVYAFMFFQSASLHQKKHEVVFWAKPTACGFELQGACDWQRIFIFNPKSQHTIPSPQ
jgi:hypothetical protein